MKRKIIALLAALLLLLTGCGEEATGEKPLAELLEKTPVSMQGGHFFFTGKVTEASAMKKMISFYEVEAEKSTFYQVEIIDDPFGCMPERTVTVCILGGAETFGERIPPEKNKEYLFDTTLWVQEDEAVFLLPTFYESLPEREGEVLYYTTTEGRGVVKGSYADYLARLQTLATENNYTAQTVLDAAKERLKSATERDAAFFKDLKFESVDQVALDKTNKKAADLLQKAESAEKTWEGIRGILE